MKIQNLIAGTILLGGTLFTVANAKATELGIDFSPAAPQGSGGSQWTLGYEFQVTSPVTVVGLATFDANGPGALTSANVPVGLWNNNGTLIASATVLAGTAASGLGSFAAVGITPITLAPGFYNVGSYDSGNAYTVSYTGNFTIAPGINLVEDLYSSDNAFEIPTLTTGNDGVPYAAWFGGNIVVPDGGLTASMLGVALIGVGCVRRMVK